MKIMISQPMWGKNDDEIIKERNYWIKKVELLGYEVANSFFDFYDTLLCKSGIKNLGVFYIAKSLEVMSKCDAILFLDGWDKARGCRIE